MLNYNLNVPKVSKDVDWCHSSCILLTLNITFEYFIKKRLKCRCFPVNNARFLRKPFSQNTWQPHLVIQHTKMTFLLRICIFLLGKEHAWYCWWSWPVLRTSDRKYKPRGIKIILQNEKWTKYLLRGSKAVPRMFSVKKLFLKCSQNLQKNTCVWIANAACIICRTAIVTMCNISCLKSGSPSKKIVYICFSKSLFKTMKNAFYFIVKALFVFERFICLSWPFGYEEKRLDKEAIDNFKIYDVKEWTTNNYNTHIVQYLK